MSKPLALTFYTSPNRGMECGRELFVFREELAPDAGNPVSGRGEYTDFLPDEYCRNHRAWFLRGSDHNGLFIELSEYFNPADLRQKADDLEQGVLVNEEYDPEDLRRLAYEIENVT
jgi:hypothetical protein